MNSITRSALSAYSQVGVETGVEGATPHQLISMLYEGAITAISAAKIHMLRKEVGRKGEAISKAIAIIEEGLKLSLDEKAGGDLARNLKDLYDYMSNRLLMANIKNEVAGLDEVGGLLADLKTAWEAIEKPPAMPRAGELPAAAPERRAALSYGKV